MDRETLSSEGGSWPSAGTFALFLSLLVFVSFPSVLLGTQTFAFRDYGLFSYPVAFFQRECFWRGEFPLWNPYSQCGLPFLAQWNTMCLYPPALLYLVLPLTWGLSFFCLVHLVWGGLGMFFLARDWTRNAFAGALAGVIFAFNGLTLNFLIWPSHIATFSWLPWVLWLTPAAWQQGGRKIPWAVAAGALQMLAGGPETILLTWIVLFLLACVDWFRRASRRARLALRFGIIVFLVTLICAAQLLPFLELLSRSQRDNNFGSTDWSMPGWGWANFLVPLFRSTPNPQGVYFQFHQYWTSSYYSGLGTLLLAAVVVRRVKEWRVRMLMALVFLACVLALGKSALVYPALRAFIPGLGVIRYPIKFVILAAALAPLVAGFGLAALQSKPSMGRFEWCSTATILLLVGIIATVDWRTAGFLILKNASTRAGFFALIVFLLWKLTRGSSPGKVSVVWGALLLTVFWVDFQTHVPNQNPTVKPEVYSRSLVQGQRLWQSPPKLAEGRAFLSPPAQAKLKYGGLHDLNNSYLLDRLGLLANCNLLEHIPQAHGFFSLAPAEISDVTSVPYVETNRDFSRLLDFMGVTEISADNDPFTWNNRSAAMPLVTIGEEPVFATDREVFNNLSANSVDLRRTALLPPEAKTAVTARLAPGATVEVVTWTPTHLRLRTHSTSQCLVVISQTFYPNWEAFVDNRPLPVWRANLAFQALQVPAGESQIDLRYVDIPFRIGVVLSGAGLVLCALWLPFARKMTGKEAESNT